jgi:ribosome-associated protein
MPPEIRAMETIEFALDREHVELHQLLKLVGLCDSGGAGKALVASGVVRVDGEVELRKSRKLRAGSEVRIGDTTIRVLGAG